MALQEGIQAVSYEAGSELAQFVFVRASTTAPRTADLATAVADRVIGVTLINALEAGHAVGVVISGIAKVRAGGPVAIGDAVGPNANGEAIPGGTAGTAIVSAAAAGEIIEVQLAV
jgi:hypothetical protein